MVENWLYLWESSQKIRMVFISMQNGLFVVLLGAVHKGQLWGATRGTEISGDDEKRKADREKLFFLAMQKCI